MMAAGRSRQRGAFLAMMVVIIVVLVGVAALALDVGRVYALRAEMQNAVDAAALAGAVELNGKDGARARAVAAARNALVHDSRYARVAGLLGEDALPDAAFAFYCVIGARPDPDDTADITAFCEGSEDEPPRWTAGGDGDAHYIAVRLDPQLAPGKFTLDLIFLPVLEVFGLDAPNELGLVASAIAGRHFYTCNYPPMLLCDPFEPSGQHFKDVMKPGQAIQLRQQGSNQWSNGNFGFLEPRGGGPGASDVSEYMADEFLMGCTPPTVTTKTGSMTNKTTAAVNVRFDIYDGPAPFNKTAWKDYPPAPNVMAYPNDQTWRVTDNRFGNGDWDFDAYWASNHPGLAPPNGWGNTTKRPARWDVYSWEIANNAIPTAGRPVAGHLNTSGVYPPPRSDANRRLLHVAVASCEAIGLTGGKKTGTIFAPDGFAKMFFHRPAEGPPNAVAYAEYVGWSAEQDANYHVDIQLYR